jgi:diguanylate cyclase
MAIDKESAEPQARWKTRYYEALGELELKERTWREAERLLRHLVSRLTLAADIRHPPLSKSLTELRNAIRDGKEVVKFRTLIETIGVQVGELDQVRSNRQALKSPARILQALLKQVPIPPALSRSAKEIDKQLNNLEELADVSGSIEQVASLLKQAIEIEKRQTPAQAGNASSLADEARGERRSKFIERIFAKREVQTEEKKLLSTNTEAPATEEQKSPEVYALVGQTIQQVEVVDASLGDSSKTIVPIIPAVVEANFSDSPKTIAPAVGDLLLQLALRLPDNVKRRINFRALKGHINKARRRKDLLPIIEVIAQNIESAYNSTEPLPVLLDTNSLNEIAEAVKAFIAHLNPPRDLQENVSRIEKIFSEQSGKIDGLVHCLHALADLVAEICSRLAVQRNELESFFTQLNLRLQELDADLQQSGKLHEATQQHVITMETDVHGEIDSIKKSMQDMNELAQVKQIIETRLDVIDNRVKAFRDTEQQRHAEAQALITRLSQKVLVLEKNGTQLRQRMEQTQQEAMQDALTGLPNRKAYEERIAMEIARCRRYKSGLVLAVFDVDNFKSVNDTYGHAAGDRVLKVIGEVLSEHVRQTDFVARYGGEEFVLLLPEADLVVAKAVADKLRGIIEQTPFHFQEKRVVITISAGLTHYRDEEAIETLFERADQSLYKAKENGRNRIEIAE